MLYNILYGKNQPSENTVRKTEEVFNSLNNVTVATYRPTFAERLHWACKFLFDGNYRSMANAMGVDSDDVVRVVNTRSNPTKNVSDAFEEKIQPLVDKASKRLRHCADSSTDERLARIETDLALIKKLLSQQ